MSSIRVLPQLLRASRRGTQALSPIVVSSNAANFHSEIPKQTKHKHKKDPDAPKRALTAYIYFANEQREGIKRDNPDITFGQIAKLTGEKWKVLTESEKAPYQAKAEKDKKRYEEEKAAYSG